MAEENRNALQLERIVFFSDAVFAIAITLLVIEIKVPHLDHAASGRDFVIALVRLIPNFVGYFFSFIVIGAYWVGHHKIYGQIASWNYGLVWRNILFLLAIAFIPFSTAFFSEHAMRRVPVVFYALVFTVAGILEIVLWRYARKAGLTDPAADPKELDHLTWRMAVLPTAGVGAILIGLVVPVFAGFAFALIPVVHWIIGKRFRKEAAVATVETEEESGTEE